MRKFAIFALFLGVLCADVKSFEELQNQPKSLAKDYYIYRLLTETKFDKAQIDVLRKDVYRYKGKLQKELNKYFKAPAPMYKGCARYWTTNILDANTSCTNFRLTPKFIKQLGSDKNRAIIAKFGANSEQALIIQGMQSQNPLQFFIDNQVPNGFFNYYYSLGKDAQNWNFNITLSSEFASKLGQYEKFGAFMEDLVINKRLPNLRKSVANMSAEFAKDEGAFWAGLNALMHGNEAGAAELFKKAGNTIQKSPHRRDNAKYWAYLITKDSAILNELANSNHVNLYSLLAKEATGNRNLELVIPNPSKERIENYDITDPFNWVRTKAKADKMGKAELIEFAKRFETQETIGEWSYMMNKAWGYKDNIYPMPFMQYIGDGDDHRKALILAIARQESRFVPSSVSISYALGMMQFMPFVAKEIAQNRKMQDFDADDMFNPKVAYNFANIHLNSLEKSFKSPVFIAYAYNGGPGFTRKTLKRGDLFNKGKFEPFLSMELVPYAESRDYAKRVLGNYVVYRQILNPNVKISVKSMLDDLLVPSKSDKIR